MSNNIDGIPIHAGNINFEGSFEIDPSPVSHQGRSYVKITEEKKNLAGAGGILKEVYYVEQKALSILIDSGSDTDSAHGSPPDSPMFSDRKWSVSDSSRSTTPLPGDNWSMAESVLSPVSSRPSTPPPAPPPPAPPPPAPPPPSSATPTKQSWKTGAPSIQLQKTYNISNMENAGLQAYTGPHNGRMNALLKENGHDGRMTLPELRTFVEEWKDEAEEGVGKSTEKTKIFQEQFPSYSKGTIIDPAEVENMLDDIDNCVKGLSKLPSYVDSQAPNGMTLAVRLFNAKEAVPNMTAKDNLLDYYTKNVGKTIATTFLTSSSAGLNAATSRQSRDTVIIITCEKGHLGKDVAPFSLNPDEKEILFPPGAKFRIDGVETKGNAQNDLQIKENRNVIYMTALAPQNP